MAFTVVEIVGRVLRRETTGKQVGFAVRNRAVALRDKVLDELELDEVVS
jgi:hypothetical protein